MATTILVDDVRSFRDGRPCVVARTADDGLSLLERLGPSGVDELWLDHDLAGPQRPDVTVMPVVDQLVQRAGVWRVGTVLVHTNNSRDAVAMTQALTAAGYVVRRWYDMRIFVNHRTEDVPLAFDATVRKGVAVEIDRCPQSGGDGS